MKIVIEIDDARFKDIRRIACVQLENYHFKTVEQIIANGTPLPKGHGDLIDRKYLIEDFKTSKKISFAERMDISCIVDHAPTIIEADKAESEG